ncbi:PTS system mannose/fructose/N-acetylgalactosamine-transporter subunit IIB [Holdemania massiliensis]|uniref:PTS system mannose/fructose/N-acetylgalactosamine-transporter subunit IIB n=1 Tax=Holdemania massiliensis TaxID=1468449 RepID=UPI001F05AA58|nr:PTS sugar transporter subunit IIB [Holdemania massiliensis]MCH1939210.1 PTS sugar transporter subunit IIB [Holdemania massiliensis]
MIRLLRIDERLIHGQVATTWTRQLGVNAIVVANDEAADNELVTMTLRMAAPPGIQVAVKNLRGAVNLLNDKRIADMKILIVADKPKDALELVRQVPGIPCVNIGNFGRVGDRHQRRSLTENFSASEEELEQLREMAELVRCEVQVLPTLPKKDLKQFL